MRTELKNNEEILFQTQPHWISLILSFLVSFVILLFTILSYSVAESKSVLFFIPFILSLLYLIYKVLSRKYNIWVVTNLRVIDEEGILSIRAKESPLDKINNVTFHQSILGRVLGYGDVIIQTAAEMGTTTTYGGIEEPMELKDAITTAQENYKAFQFANQASNISKLINQEPASDTIECPYCAETIKKKAKVCRFCNRDIHLVTK